MHIGLSFTRIYVWNKASKVLSWSCGLACGVYQGRTLWLRLWHSTESSCKVNKGVIHLFICAYSSPPCCYVPLASSSWLNLILYQLWGSQLLSRSPNCLVYQIPVSDTRPSLKKKKTLKGKRVPTLRGTDTLWARSASQTCLNGVTQLTYFPPLLHCSSANMWQCGFWPAPAEEQKHGCSRNFKFKLLASLLTTSLLQDESAFLTLSLPLFPFFFPSSFPERVLNADRLLLVWC